jgi:hypothetical protein
MSRNAHQALATNSGEYILGAIRATGQLVFQRHVETKASLLRGRLPVSNIPLEYFKGVFVGDAFGGVPHPNSKKHLHHAFFSQVSNAKTSKGMKPALFPLHLLARLC